MGKWHNHESNDTKLLEGSITASDEDIDHFLLEQLLDDFFLADFFLCYEDMDFSGSFYKKNQYSYDIKKVFSNLDYVKERLSSWCYSAEHFYK